MVALINSVDFNVVAPQHAQECNQIYLKVQNKIILQDHDFQERICHLEVTQYFLELRKAEIDPNPNPFFMFYQNKTSNNCTAGTHFRVILFTSYDKVHERCVFLSV